MKRKICRSHPKPSAAEATYLYGGNAKKVIRGRRRCEAVRKHLHDVPNALKSNWQQKENSKWKCSKSDSSLKKSIREPEDAKTISDFAEA